MDIDIAIQSFPLWAQWITSWGMKLYPSYEWLYSVEDYGDFPTTSFTSDKFGIKARQVVWQNWKSWGYRIRKRGIIIEFGLEDVFLLKGMDAYERVTVLKSILHEAILEAPIIGPMMYYPVFQKPVEQKIGNASQVRREK